MHPALAKFVAVPLALASIATSADACYRTTTWTEYGIGPYLIRYYQASSQRYHRDFYASAAQRCVEVANLVFYDDADRANMVSRQCRAHMLNHFNRYSGQICR